MKNEIPSNNNFDELHKLVKNYDITLIAYVLKRITDIDHALSYAEINEHLNHLLQNSDDSPFFDSRTTKRKLDVIEKLLSSENILVSLNQIFASTYGGSIKYREADGLYNKQYPHKQGKQKRYYFEPLLKSSDMELIYGTINSSRYLSEAEREYLLARLEILHPAYNMEDKEAVSQRNAGINFIEALPEMPNSNHKPAALDCLPLPGSSSAFLRNVQIIHRAIEDNVQIKVLYGIYDISERTGKVNFHIRNKNNEPYILNPYAMIWNDGEYYLVASDQTHADPTHYRVDRIIEVEIHKETNDDGYWVNTPRDKVPDILREYYERNKNGQVVFNGIKYANSHPAMAIRKGNKLIDCSFECTNWSLQMLVDTFGPDIRIKKSTLPHKASDVDYNGNPQEFLIATIHKVQYDNVKRFAINNCQYLTVVGPDELVTEVKQVLKEAVKKLG